MKTNLMKADLIKGITMEAQINEIKFTDKDIVNPDDFISKGEYNPHKVHGYLLHDHGFTLAVVFASNLQDALDEAADDNRLRNFKIEEEDYDDYKVNTAAPTCSFLGNGDEPYDIESIGVIELKNPPFSFVALYNAMEK